MGAAKGYNSPIVLVLGADLYPATTEGRASFSVAATRATVRLFVAGLRTPGTLAVEAASAAVLLDEPAPQVEVVPVVAEGGSALVPAGFTDPEPVLLPSAANLAYPTVKPTRLGLKRLLSRAFRR